MRFLTCMGMCRQRLRPSHVLYVRLLLSTKKSFDGLLITGSDPATTAAATATAPGAVARRADVLLRHARNGGGRGRRGSVPDDERGDPQRDQAEHGAEGDGDDRRRAERLRREAEVPASEPLHANVRGGLVAVVAVRHVVVYRPVRRAG